MKFLLLLFLKSIPALALFNNENIKTFCDYTVDQNIYRHIDIDNQYEEEQEIIKGSFHAICF